MINVADSTASYGAINVGCNYSISLWPKDQNVQRAWQQLPKHLKICNVWYDKNVFNQWINTWVAKCAVTLWHDVTLLLSP